MSNTNSLASKKIIGETFILPILERKKLSILEPNSEIEALRFIDIKIVDINTSETLLGVSENKKFLIPKHIYHDCGLKTNNEINQFILDLFSNTCIPVCNAERLYSIKNKPTYEIDFYKYIEFKELLKIRNFSSHTSYTIENMELNLIQQYPLKNNEREFILYFDKNQNSLSINKLESLNIRNEDFIFYGFLDIDKAIVDIPNSLYREINNKKKKKSKFSNLFRLNKKS